MKSKISIKFEKQMKKSAPNSASYSQEEIDFFDELLQDLNEDHLTANEIGPGVLRFLCEYSSERYYSETDQSPVVLKDEVYDYIQTIIAMKGEKIVVGDDDMRNVPDMPAERMIELPIWMGSTKKINMGTGQYEIWKRKYSGPYLISAKMDGASALLVVGDGTSPQHHQLFSRGKGNKGQNISEFLDYIQFGGDISNLPAGTVVRGELIMKQSVFNAKYKRASSSDTVKFSNSRNAVSGMVNKMGSNASKGVKTPLNDFQEEFVRNIDFVAYEFITLQPLKASEQFAKLVEMFGDNVAKHVLVDAEDIDEDELSMMLDEYMETMDYEIDGLVICDDHVYERPYGENPDYLRAFKKPLEVLTATTEVTSVEWDVSKEGFLRPVVHFKPIDLDGVTIRKASGYNAKNIRDAGLGPGAIIDVVRSGGVIPKIIKVHETAEPALPDVEFTWNESGVHIIPSDPRTRKVEIKKLHHFLVKMGTKGIGEKTMMRLYDGGIQTIPALLSLTEEKLDFIGGKTAKNIVKTINENKKNLTLPVLAGASGCFGSLMGVTRCELIWSKYPDLLDEDCVIDDDKQEIINLLTKVDKVSTKTAQQAADGFNDFLEFIDVLYSECNIEPAKFVPSPTVSPMNSGSKYTGTTSTASKIGGEHILLTGFRDREITDFITMNGGKVLKSLTKSATMLVVKDENTSNNKTRDAEQRGIKIITRDEFKQRFNL